MLGSGELSVFISESSKNLSLDFNLFSIYNY